MSDVDSEGRIEGIEGIEGESLDDGESEGFSEPMLGMFLDGELDSFGGSVVKRMSSLKLKD